MWGQQGGEFILLYMLAYALTVPITFLTAMLPVHAV
jgi:hypothetical protein